MIADRRASWTRRLRGSRPMKKIAILPTLLTLGNAVCGFSAIVVASWIDGGDVENTPDPASHRRFKGLPSPAGAGCIVSLAILRSLPADNWAALDPGWVREIVKYWAPLGGLAVALLMVSRVSYPHLTKQVLRGR